MDYQKIDRTKIRVIKKNSKEENDDVDFWLSQTPAQRISALEEIRAEYNLWKYGPDRGFQRVYKIIKRERG
jgi:hypothetical protein